MALVTKRSEVSADGPATPQPILLLDKDFPRASAAVESVETGLLSARSDCVDGGWDGHNDPKHPFNFSASCKVLNIGTISALTLITSIASSMFAPGIPQLMKEFHSSDSMLANFVLSVYVLGFAIGPLVVAPTSELYGRVLVYHVCNIGFIICTIVCAVSSSLAMLIVFRFFQGCFGVAPVTNGGGTVGDLVVQEKRGAAIALFALGPILGPAIGPVVGGYIVAARGWRWVFWILSMISGALALFSFAVLRETYPPVLLRRKMSHLAPVTSARQLFWRAIVRPTKIFLFSPVVLATSIYTGIVSGYQYLMFSTFTLVFEQQYGFPTQSVGLTFLGIGIGSLIGLIGVGIFSDRHVKATSRSKPGDEADRGDAQPESRLPPLIAGAICLPFGLFLYGWSVQYTTHWIFPQVGTAFVGMGNIAVFVCIVSYLVDAFTIYSASAVAANTVIRSVMGGILPLAGQKMYSTLGYGWGNSLLGFVAFACIPVPILLLRYGARMRRSFDVVGRL